MSGSRNQHHLQRRRSPWWHPILTTIFPSAVIPVAVALLINGFLGPVRWANEPLHSLVEGVGSFAAILLAVFIIIMRRSDQLRPGYIWVATTLMGMGLLDGFHAAVGPGPAFVWLHSAATFLGGITFAMVALPERLSRRPVLNAAPYLAAALSVILGTVSVIFPDGIPAMTVNGRFSPLAQALNLLGGGGFIVAWFHFAWQEKAQDQGERLLLANHCLLFGMAGVLFHFSELWDATWWLWHVLRLVAYLVVLWFFLGLFNDDVRRIRESELALKLRGQELERTRTRLSDIIENSPSIITLKDNGGRFVLVNRRFQELFGLNREAVAGKTMAELFPARDNTQDMAADARVIERQQPSQREETIAIGGEPRTFITSRFPLISSGHGVYGVGCIRTDISERKSMEERLHLAKLVIDTTSEAVVVTNTRGEIVDINDAYTQITGYDREELLGRNPRITQSGHHDKAFFEGMWRELTGRGQWAGEIWDRRKNGDIYPKWLTINAIRDSEKRTTHYVGVFTDISEKKATENKLKNLAFYDPLTELPNRLFFRERLDEALLASRRHGQRTALMFIDLDRFKDVNDTLGHTAGDELIAQASRRIVDSLRDTDTVARLGGDEFTVILTELENEESAGHVAQQIIERIQEHFLLFGTEVFISASIGISLYPEDGEDSDTLIKNADTAMYHAKENGRGNCQFFRAEMNERMLRRVTLERDLRRALENGEFILHYQPRYVLETGQMAGSEALIRWNHPGEGLISPAEFIPVAEETNLIIPIGEWVLREACRQTIAWHRQELGLLHISVNLSSRQFQQQNLTQLIRDTLLETGLDPDFLELEITESVVTENPEEAARLLLELRQMGVHIAIDDFGTGYSSLAYLKRFPIDALKIDRSFIQDLPDDPEDAAIVESIIAMARSLGINVVAEGVESAAQRTFLKERGCREVQGFYFSKPLPAPALTELLKAPAGHAEKKKTAHVAEIPEQLRLYD